MGVSSILAKMFGTASERKLKKIRPLVDQVNQKYAVLSAVSGEQLKKRTREFQEMIQTAREAAKAEIKDTEMSREEREEHIITAEQRVLDDIMPEAFAMVKEVSRRLTGQEWTAAGHKITWNMVPYDVQIIGAIVLHQSRIAEMKTGEGKTLVATMPIYLNALTGRGVHLVTVNDYLAQRDSQWMGRIYSELGLTVGCILNTMGPEDRRAAYQCDITYGTNNEFGFDYLRDNMAVTPENQVQRGHYYCIIDEVDNILIDEARTPLIISGPVSDSRHGKFAKLNPAVSSLVRLQKNIITSLIADLPPASEQLKSDDGLPKKLHLASQGSPKHRRLRKLLEDMGYQKLLQKGEKEYLLLTNAKTGTSISQDEYFQDLYFYVEEKQNNITLTPKGEEKLAELLGVDEDELVIPDLGEEMVKIDERDDLTQTEKEKLKLELDERHSRISDRYHNISQLLRAHTLYEKDVEYVVQEGKVLIVDEFTGRILPGRRYSDGLHQAIEAKEKVQVEAETQTFATITLQNYFRMYDKLAGMTGTAITEAAEFEEIYDLEVVEIPTHKPCIRKDFDDRIYKTRREKYNAIIDGILERHHKGQPILVGTISVDVSETISRMLRRHKIPHNVLNAKHHQREAEIVSLAGEKGAVTIATNMAGRGTDIKLGEGVKERGGLFIMGTERHESRRIDLQLRGRSGRQGDPGESQFFVSLEDDLMRLFNSDRIVSVMNRMGVEKGQVITHPMVTRSIERAQKKVEERNFGIRKHLLEYDNVMNQQREVVYDRRDFALKGEDLKAELFEILKDWVSKTVDQYADRAELPEAWDWDNLRNELVMTLGIDYYPQEGADTELEELKQTLVERARKFYNQKEAYVGQEQMRFLEKFVTLRTIDEMWKEHLYAMDQLKEGINWRAYGQKDPLLEYKGEAFQAFAEMITEMDHRILRLCFRAQIAEPTEQEGRRQQPIKTEHRNALGMGFSGATEASAETPPSGASRQQGAPPRKKQPVKVGPKVGRNDPCPCGSGKKYKKCCGRL